MTEIKLIEENIRNRRSVFPPVYIKQKIDAEELKEILENARWAPTHRKTEPWRFKVFQGAALERLSNYLGNYYKDHTPEELFSEMKYKKTVKKPLQSACILAIIMHRDPAESVPEWEEIASVAMAVQNIWLSCSARDIGAYWSSPKSITEARAFLQLKENERCLGLFYMGKTDPLLKIEAGSRKPLDEIIEWI